MKKISIIIILLWMAFIFYNSSNNSAISNEKSFRFLNILRNSKNIILEKGNNDGVNSNDGANSNDEGIKNESQLPKDENKLPRSVRDRKLNILIRKNAHAFEYIVFSILISHILMLYGMKGKDAIIYILFISLFYALTDEYHQSFVQGRGSLVSDVFIDFGGSLIGVCSYNLFIYTKQKIKVSSKSILNKSKI